MYWSCQLKLNSALNLKKKLSKYKFFVRQSSIYVTPNMRTISLWERGSLYANILAILARMHTGIPVYVRQSLYA